MGESLVHPGKDLLLVGSDSTSPEPEAKRTCGETDPRRGVGKWQ